MATLKGAIFTIQHTMVIDGGLTDDFNSLAKRRYTGGDRSDSVGEIRSCSIMPEGESSQILVPRMCHKVWRISLP